MSEQQQGRDGAAGTIKVGDRFLFHITAPPNPETIIVQSKSIIKGKLHYFVESNGGGYRWLTEAHLRSAVPLDDGGGPLTLLLHIADWLDDRNPLDDTSRRDLVTELRDAIGALAGELAAFARTGDTLHDAARDALEVLDGIARALDGDPVYPLVRSELRDALGHWSALARRTPNAGARR